MRLMTCGPSPPPWYCLRPSRMRKCPDSIPITCTPVRICAVRWMLQHRPGDTTVSANEELAIAEINKAIGAIKPAAIDDGKNIEEHPSVDRPPDDRGRLHRALERLTKVHADVAREEDDPVTRGLRDRAVVHIDAAIAAVEQGR
jgi:hypothetical protein